MKLTVELVLASISRNARRFLTQAAVVAVVVLAGCGALAVARSGTDALAATITDSGALRYELTSVEGSGGSAPFPLSTIDLLAAASNVEGVVARVGLPISVTDLDGRAAQDDVGVLAVSASYLDSVEWAPVAGVAPFSPSATDPGAQATLGEAAAAKLGITPDCVATQACGLRIGGVEFRVASVARFEDPSLDNSGMIDLTTAVESDLSDGPTTITVEAVGLPTSAVANSLDHIASTSGRTVFVEAPDTGGALRTGVAATWASTITTVAIVLMGLGAVAQIAMQLTTIRFRRAEIATLRSLGCTPAAVVAQFTLEPAIVALAGAGAGLVASATIVRVLDRLDVDAVLPLNGALAIAAAAVVSTTAASYLAARSTARVAPAEVIGT